MESCESNGGRQDKEPESSTSPFLSQILSRLSRPSTPYMDRAVVRTSRAFPKSRFSAEVSYSLSRNLGDRGTSARARSEFAEYSNRKQVFVDAAAMKEKVRQNLMKDSFKITDLYKTTGCWQQIARSAVFEQITLGVIAFNALWIAVDTDYNGEEMLLDAHPVFQVAENAFCLFFSFEWLVRFASFKRKIDGFKDFSFLFDTALVATMILETWALTAYALLSSGGGSGGVGNASILRIARLLRLSRMARMARLMRAVPELMVLIKGMVAATRSVFFTLCLLILIMYVFAVAFTQVTDGTRVGERLFDNVAGSMYTLLVHGALLDDVSSIASELGDESVFFAAVFFVFSLLAALTVMNMLIGVLCEVVSAVAATEKEEMMVGYVNEKLRQVLSLVDTDGNMKITKKEFVEILENVEAGRALQEVGVDVVGLIDFADFIFEDDSTVGDEAERELSFADFMEVVLQLRGSNNATVKDVVDLRKFIRRALIQTNLEMSTLRKEVVHLLSGQNKLASSLSQAFEVLESGPNLRPSMYSLDVDDQDEHVQQTLCPPEQTSLYESMVIEGNATHINVKEGVAALPKQSVGRGQVSRKEGSSEFHPVDEGHSPVSPLPTPSAHLLRYRAQETHQLLWGGSAERPANYRDNIALQGHWGPLESSPLKNAEAKSNNDLPRCAIEVQKQTQEEVLGQLARLGQVLTEGIDEFRKLQDSLVRNAALAFQGNSAVHSVVTESRGPQHAKAFDEKPNADSKEPALSLGELTQGSQDSWPCIDSLLQTPGENLSSSMRGSP